MKTYKKLVGVFPLSVPIHLYFDTSVNGADFNFIDEDKSTIRIFNADSDSDLLELLLHEAFEFMLAATDSSYIRTGAPGGTDCRTFLFTHDTYSRACQYVGNFLYLAWPPLYKEWIRYNKKNRKKVK